MNQPSDEAMRNLLAFLLKTSAPRIIAKQQRIFRLLEGVNEPDFVAANNEHAVIYGIKLALLQLGYNLQEKEGEPNGDKSGEVATAETSTEKSAADARAAKGEG